MHKLFTNWASLPNILTYLRIGAILLVVFFYYLPWEWSHWTAAGIFVIAAVTDWMDGYLARMWKLRTALGEFLDPLADKLLISICLILLVQAYDNLLATLIAMVIIGRELSVMALRGLLAKEEGVKLMMGRIPVSVWGKAKTFLQMLGIACFLAFPPQEESLLPDWIALAILTLAAFMTLLSAFLYGRTLWQSKDE